MASAIQDLLTSQKKPAPKKRPAAGPNLGPFGTPTGAPIQGPPAPTAKDLTYKQWLKGRTSTKPLAMQYAKEKGDSDLYYRLYAKGRAIEGPPAPTTTKKPATTPAATTPTVTPTPAASTTVSVPQISSDPTVGKLPPAPGATTLSSVASAGSVPMPKNFPSIDINALYAPAERAIASQRAAALAAQNKAFADNMAFEQFIQGATGKANEALAGTLGTLSTGAAQSRQQSVDNLNNAIATMQAGAGGSGDLARLAGSTAAGQSNQLLQGGQAALNAVPDIVGQAALKYGQDQQQVGAAQGRVMNDAAIRATQAALADTAQQQTALETAKAGAAVSDVANQRDYLIQAGQLDALNKFNAGKLSEQEYATQSKLYADLAKVKSDRDVANIKAQTAAQVEAGKMSRADAANLNKLAVEQLRQTGQTNRTLLTVAAKNKVKGDFGSKAVTLINNKLRNLPQDVKSQNRFDRGQTVRGIVADLKNSFGANANRPNGLTYDDAYSLISGIPKAGPEALKDPAFIAFLKTQFPKG